MNFIAPTSIYVIAEKISKINIFFKTQLNNDLVRKQQMI